MSGATAQIIPLRVTSNAGHALEDVDAVELELTCRVRLDRNHADGLFMVLANPRLCDVRVRRLERRSGSRLYLRDMAREARRRLKRLLTGLSVDVWCEPGR